MTAPDVAVAAELRMMLVTITGDPAVAGLGDDVALLGRGVGLDSVGGMRLLRAVLERWGVDVAAEDLNLDAMESVGSLAVFVRAHLG